MKVGGGLIYYRTTEDLVQGFNFLGQEGGAELGTSGGKVSYDLSLEITPVPAVPLTMRILSAGCADLHLAESCMPFIESIA